MLWFCTENNSKNTSRSFPREEPCISLKTETWLTIEICNHLKMYPIPSLSSLRILLHNCVYFLIIPASWETKTIHNFRVKIQFSQTAFVHSLTVSPWQIYEFISKALGWAPTDLKCWVVQNPLSWLSNPGAHLDWVISLKIRVLGDSNKPLSAAYAQAY